MNVLTKKRHEIGKRDVISVLETVDVETGKRVVLHEFDFLIEAPNWKKNGTELIYNSEGRIFSYDITSDISTLIESGICDHCNNDHVLSPDHTKLAVSHHTYEDGMSRIYIFPVEGEYLP
ncbi:TolB-like translocation protein [Anaerocolumna sedimenticola]|uniref:hypothetical protein n=1 Tax=Anaerocolumna sedimenticola TaxID=2696063 RepID=UPI00192A253C|nr:hypothetical protein [Anaerocolumna sedimenticola]